MLDKGLEDLTIEDLNREIFEIYQTTKDDNAKINALCNLIMYKKDEKFKANQSKLMEGMFATF